MKATFKGLLMLFMALVVQIAFAQEKTVTGAVTDDDDLPIPGVSVTVQGTTTGTSTDFDGEFSIKASEGDVLEFSYIGYDTQTHTVGAQDVINVKLSSDVTSLGEVMVVGYGKTTKQAFTGTAIAIKSEDIVSKNVSSATQALAGEISGVNVINTSGQPGAEPTIRIRGFGSVNGNRSPLIVVDGIPFSGSINDINPNDIADLTVLKDATATAVYGSRGANGVILIETKRGVAGKSEINVSVKTGQNFQLIPRMDVISSPEMYAELSWEGLKNKATINGVDDPISWADERLFSSAGLSPDYNLWNVDNGADLIDPATGKVRSGVSRKYSPERWRDEAFQAAVRTEADLSFSGGHEKTTYYASFGYLNDKGYSINSDFNRYTAQLNLKQGITDWLDGSLNLGYSLSKSNNNGQSEDSGSIFWFVDNAPPIYPVFARDADGNKIVEPIYGTGYLYDYGEARSFGTGTNSLADATYGLAQTKAHAVNLSNEFTAKITDGLTFDSRFGMQYRQRMYSGMNSPFYGPSASAGGSVSKQNNTYFSYNFLQLLRYSKVFGDHSIEAFAAHEIDSWERQYLSGYKSNLVIPDIPELNNAVVSSPSSSFTQDYTQESYFGQLSYNYDSRYFVQGTIRRDGSSRFLKGNKWGTFGSVGAAWVLSNENFLAGTDWVDMLKIKASFGTVGDQAGVGYYPGYDTFNANNLNDEISLGFRGKGNPDLTWETTQQLQLGLEFGLGKVFEGSIDYYLNDTKDQIFDRQVPISLGYASIKVNDGVLRNSGLEFDLVGHVVKTNDFYLDVTLNGATLKNKMTDMPIDPATNKQKVIDVDGSYGRAVGHSLYDYYLREWAGVDPEDGAAQWNVYYDNATGTKIDNMHDYMDRNPNADIRSEKTKDYSEATRKYVGKSAIPDVQGGFGIKAGYKGFDLAVQFRYGIGGYAYDGLYGTLMHNQAIGGNNWHKDILNRWQKPGDITDVPRISDNADQNVNGTSTRFLTNKSYLQLNNVRLGYTFPKDIVESLGMDNLNIFVSGTNLMLLTKRDGFNPTLNEPGTSSMYHYSPLSTVTGGINITF